MNVERIFVGGWFQRTTLHLSEIYDFLKEAESPLDLDKKKLFKLRDSLSLSDIELSVADLEYIRITTSDDVEVKIFEDGLILLGKNNTGEVKNDITDLTLYYEEKLSPAISYIYSLLELQCPRSWLILRQSIHIFLCSKRLQTLMCRSY